VVDAHHSLRPGEDALEVPVPLGAADAETVAVEVVVPPDAVVDDQGVVAQRPGGVVGHQDQDVIEVPRPVEKGLRDAGLELREMLSAGECDDAESEVVACAPLPLALEEDRLEPEVAEQTPELEGVALGTADAGGAGVAVEQ